MAISTDCLTIKSMPSEFQFITEWHIAAPLDAVYETITHCLDWPAWWKGVVNVEKLASGNADGVGSVHRFTWQGRIPYRFTFAMRVTGVAPLTFLEGRADGEVTGTGRWDFSRENEITIVRYHWRVHTNRRWMNLIAPVAAPVFQWNHHQVMRQGAEGMARWLNAELKTFRASAALVKTE